MKCCPKPHWRCDVIDSIDTSEPFQSPKNDEFQTTPGPRGLQACSINAVIDHLWGPSRVQGSVHQMIHLRVRMSKGFTNANYMATYKAPFSPIKFLADTARFCLT